MMLLNVIPNRVGVQEIIESVRLLVLLKCENRKWGESEMGTLESEMGTLLNGINLSRRIFCGFFQLFAQHAPRLVH
jgi:hypothetical protein